MVDTKVTKKKNKGEGGGTNALYAPQACVVVLEVKYPQLICPERKHSPTTKNEKISRMRTITELIMIQRQRRKRGRKK